MLTKRELAKELRVHPNTIDRWRKLGMPTMKVGSVIRFDLETTRAWMLEQWEKEGK